MRDVNAQRIAHFRSVIAAAAISVPLLGQQPNTAKPDHTATTQEKSDQKFSEFPLGTATPAEECGACHQAICREYRGGSGS
jgi:hypothetical protein